MNFPLEDYASLIFDCDGVLLNSNPIKTRAFYKATLPYGEDAATAMVDYHLSNGGISRYEKFDYFLEEIISSRQKGPEKNELLENFAREVRSGLLSCEISPGIQELRIKTSLARWCVVSGGDQEELRYVFGERGLKDFFDGGIFGSPDSKDEIIAREREYGNICFPALFLGDSKYDYDTSIRAGVDFVFVSDWSEFTGWRGFFDGRSNVIGKLAQLTERS